MLLNIFVVIINFTAAILNLYIAIRTETVLPLVLGITSTIVSAAYLTLLIGSLK